MTQETIDQIATAIIKEYPIILAGYTMNSWANYNDVKKKLIEIIREKYVLSSQQRRP